MPEKNNKNFDALVAANAIDLETVNDQFSIGVIAYGQNLQRAMEKENIGIFFTELGHRYRDIYGREPWNEFLVCSKKNDPKCKNQKGLAPDQDLQTMDREFYENPEKFCCPDCNSPMELFYDPHLIVSSLQNAFNDKVFASLLIREHDRTIAGFSLGWETTVKEGYKDKVIVGKGDPPEPAMSYQEYLDEFTTLVGPHNEAEKIFNSADWAMSREARGAGSSISVLNAIYRRAQKELGKSPQDEVPVIGHTLNISKAKDIFVRIGFTAGTKTWLDDGNDGHKQVRVYSTLPRLIDGTKPKTAAEKK